MGISPYFVAFVFFRSRTPEEATRRPIIIYLLFTYLFVIIILSLFFFGGYMRLWYKASVYRRRRKREKRKDEIARASWTVSRHNRLAIYFSSVASRGRYLLFFLFFFNFILTKAKCITRRRTRQRKYISSVYSELASYFTCVIERILLRPYETAISANDKGDVGNKGKRERQWTSKGNLEGTTSERDNWRMIYKMVLREGWVSLREALILLGEIGDDANRQTDRRNLQSK